MKIIEAWGAGLGRIRNSCKEYGLPEPAIEESGDGFQVIFYRRTAKIELNVSSGKENNIEIQNSSIESGMSVTESSTESNVNIIKNNIKNGKKNGFCSIENRLIELLVQYPAITQQEAAEKLGYSKAWIRKIMKKMQQEGVLHREGATKKGVWIVKR